MDVAGVIAIGIGLGMLHPVECDGPGKRPRLASCLQRQGRTDGTYARCSHCAVATAHTTNCGTSGTITPQITIYPLRFNGYGLELTAMYLLFLFLQRYSELKLSTLRVL